MAAILLAEDDAALRHWITVALTSAGHEVEAVPDGIQAAQRLRVAPYALLLLDIGLPFVDGWAILAELESRDVPSVIVISARGDERDKVRALDLGADDYLTKPFGTDELLARVRALLRRSTRATAAVDVVTAADVTVDLAARSVARDGVEVRLTPTEWALLAELASHAGLVLEHRHLLGEVWGAEYVGDRNYLRTFIQRLRRKLENDPADPRVVVTVGRQGYRFGGPREVADG